jgi:endogenous inhibitor of DNA gyrase (YacG/DUF329 family)
MGPIQEEPTVRLPRCPVCDKPVDPSKSEAFPFCSPRCRTLDLGRWLDERYSVPEIVQEEDEDDSLPDGPDES